VAAIGPAQFEPREAIARKEVRNAIEKAVDEPPPSFRSVFMLRAIEQMSVEETESCPEIPGDTVNTRFHRANKLLRQTLTTQFGAIFDDTYPFTGHAALRSSEGPRLPARLSSPHQLPTIAII